MQEKRKPIWPSLYLEMIIKKKVHQSINQSKDNQKGFTYFLKVFVDISGGYTINNCWNLKGPRFREL